MFRTVLLALFFASLPLRSSLAAVDERLPDSSIYKGEIEARYTSPDFFFKYYGFEWVGYIGDSGVYWLHAGLLVSALMISAGFCYRFAVAFLLKEYTE